MKKLFIFSLLFLVPTIGFGAKLTKNGQESRVGKFINPRTKQAIEVVKQSPTIAAKIEAFKRVPTRTHLPELNPHIAQLKMSVMELENPHSANLEKTIADAKNSIDGLLAVRAVATNADDVKAIDELIAQMQTIFSQLAEQHPNVAQARLLRSAADGIHYQYAPAIVSKTRAKSYNIPAEMKEQKLAKKSMAKTEARKKGVVQ